MALVVGDTQNFPIGISNKGLLIYKLKSANCNLNISNFDLKTDFNCRWQLLYASVAFASPSTVTLTITKTSVAGAAYSRSSIRDFSKFTDTNSNPNLTLYEFVGENPQDIYQVGEELELSIPKTTGQPLVYGLIQGIQLE